MIVIATIVIGVMVTIGVVKILVGSALNVSSQIPVPKA